MLRSICFFIVIIIPVIFGWWLFFPLALIYVYLAKMSYEIIVVGLILDTFYYFGDNLWQKHLFLIFSFLLLGLAWFLSSRIHWRKII